MYSCIFKDRRNNINTNTNDTTIDSIEKELESFGIREGGEYLPKDCKPNHRVAIIVAYRNRPDQLKIFLRYMHPFLIKQNIHYSIFVVELVQNITFNKGMLMNIGYLESLKSSNDFWDCHVIQDIDTLPEDDRNFYTCLDDPNTVRHMARYQSRWNYQ